MIVSYTLFNIWRKAVLKVFIHVTNLIKERTTLNNQDVIEILTLIKELNKK